MPHAFIPNRNLNYHSSTLRCLYKEYKKNLFSGLMSSVNIKRILDILFHVKVLILHSPSCSIQILVINVHYFLGEGSSGSEEDNSEDDSDSRDNASLRCQHCFSTSKQYSKVLFFSFYSFNFSRGTIEPILT